MSSSETTVDHETIKTWTEKRGGRPSIVRATENNGRKGGVLRLDFAEKDEAFDEVSWDDFFEVFEESNLAFLYQDKTADGKESRFNRFVHREGTASSGKKSAAPNPRKAAPSARTASGRSAGSQVTKAALMEKARAKNVPGRSRMSKAELEKAVA